MQVKNLKNKSVGIHDFSMNPRAQVMRSVFGVRQARKTAFSASYLVPIYCEEVLPGDTFNIRCHVACRTAIPIVPVLDNWHMDFFAFYTPVRVVWPDFQKMMGAQDNPGDSIAFTVPQCQPTTGYATSSLQDYFGLMTIGMNPATPWTHSAIPLRMYNRIFNDWFRSQDLTGSAPVHTGAGPDPTVSYTLLSRAKRPDYFAAGLPFPQKGTAVTLPLGSTAPVIRDPAQPIPYFSVSGDSAFRNLRTASGSTATTWSPTPAATGDARWADGSGGLTPGLIANLAAAVGPTVNTFRQYFQTQKYMERQARGGTRYTEIIQSHFGVRPPDYRLDRPEYIGGGHIPILTNAIPQTSATGLTGGTTPAGTLAATGFAEGSVGFNYSAQEHGYIIVLVNVRVDQTYQQGLRRHWKRFTALDFYFPVFAMLGEQPVYNYEIYADGSANDALTFSYMPRWDEYRHFPSEITGIFRSSAVGTIDYWHSAQKFAALPSLNNTFITDNSRTILERNFAAGPSSQGQQFLCDFMFTGRVARPLPTHSVPGMIDHF